MEKDRINTGEAKHPNWPPSGGIGLKNRAGIFIIAALVFVQAPGFTQPVSFTNQSGLLNTVAGFSTFSDCALDMNGDLLDDAVRVGKRGLFIDFQRPDGSFFQKYFPMPVQSLPEWSICAGDLDNNGFNDLLLAGSSTVSFVIADGNGSMYTEFVMPVSLASQRSTMADIDNDGWLDTFVCHEQSQSVPFRNDGAGNMIPDTNLIHTADRPGNYSAIWTDYDNDNDIDLYITKCLANAPPGDINRTNLLYRNDGGGAFTEVGAVAGLDDNAQSWSTVFEDFDNDGYFDAFIVNHDSQNRLFRNDGDGTFTDMIGSSGIDPNDLGAWENASGDFNNDGFMDIFSELGQELYLGNGDLTFSGQEAPVTPGAIADLNDDGFLDVFHLGQLWLNEGNANHWLKVAPFGVSGNRNGIGARVELYGTWGVQVREVRSGQSFSPMNSLILHFGLGQSDHVDSLKIKWPSGVVTKMESLIADTTYLVPESHCLLPPAGLTIAGSQHICPGDTTVLLAPAGYANYSWSNKQEGQALPVSTEGRFFAVLTDSAGCIALSHPADIHLINDLPPFIFSTGGNTVCEGDTLVLTASTGENYSWSNGLTGIQAIPVAESGSYIVAVDALCSQGQLTSQPFQVIVLPSPPPIVSGATIVQGDSVLLTAAGENCLWFDQPEGGNLLASGPTYQTPPLSTSATYFVESHQWYPAEIQSGGKPDTSGTGALPIQGGFLSFESWQPFTLLSVSVFLPPGAPPGNRFVQLFSEDTLLAFKLFAVDTGLNVLDLGFEVPVGKFSLHCPQGGLWRNSGPLGYPYPIGNMGQILTSSSGTGFYYYFYDWKVQKPGFECVSERSSVDVTVTNTDETNRRDGVSVFPNPALGQVFVESDKDISYFCLFDAKGQEVMRRDPENGRSFRIDMEGLPSGMFFLQLIGEGFQKMEKVLKL